jgi:hypothetical protein
MGLKMDSSVVLMLVGFVSLVMLFAQLKLFSIDSTLKAILQALQDQKRRDQAPAQSVSEVGEGTPAQEVALRPCSRCGKELPVNASRCPHCLETVFRR